MAGKKAGGRDVALEDLQALGKDMQEGVGFDPPVQFKETDYDNLLFDVRHNAKDLDPVKDANAISEKGKRTLVKIKAGPWWEEEQEPELPKEEQRTSQRGTAKTKPVKTTPEKPENEDVKKKGKKEKAKPKTISKAAKPKAMKPAQAKGKKELGKKAQSGEKYTRLMAFADALREGAKTEAVLITKAHRLYEIKNKKKASIKVAAEIHKYAMGTLKALKLVKEKNGLITV